MCCFATIFSHNKKLKTTIHEKCPLRSSTIFRDIPSDIILLTRMPHPWNSTQETIEFNGIPPYIILMSEIEGLKREIESLKGTLINQLQYGIEKRSFSFMEHNTKKIIDAIALKKTDHGRNSE